MIICHLAGLILLQSDFLAGILFPRKSLSVCSQQLQARLSGDRLELVIKPIIPVSNKTTLFTKLLPLIQLEIKDAPISDLGQVLRLNIHLFLVVLVHLHK